MNTILAVGASHAFYLAFLILKKQKTELSDWFLFTLFFCYGNIFSLIFVALEYQHDEFLLLLLNINLIITPLFFLYIRTITNQNRKLRFSDIFLLVPYLGTTAYWISLFATTNEFHLIQIFSNTLFFEKPAGFIISVLIDAIAMPLFLIFVLIHQGRHEKNLFANYSYTEGIDFKWIRFLAIIMLFDWCLTHLYPIVIGTGIHDNKAIGQSTAFSTVFLFIMGYYGLKQGYLYLPRKIESSNTVSQRENRTGITDLEAEYYSDKIIKFMNIEKPYLNSTLSLNDLAEMSAMSRHTLSWVINEKLNKNFYNFINEYRVEEFKTRALLPKYRNLTILAIAIDCGFNSKATFNRIFKQSTGQTPNQFINT